jgi:hypothetical protein
MFETETVFVLGAGASNEFGFPLGSTLAKDIRNLTGPIPQYVHGPVGDLISAMPPNPDLNTLSLMLSGQKIHEALAFGNSIDDFLHSRRDDRSIVMLGKLAIAQLILEYERKSPLVRLTYNHDQLGSLNLQETWLFQLAKLMFKDLTPAEAVNVFDNVTFITFNYDRSLELFFKHAISENFSIPTSASEEIVAEAPIYHAYGSVGPMFSKDSKANVMFGDQHAWRSYERVAGRIRTYTETSHDAAIRDAIFGAMTTAERVVFLGCGYHLQNLDLLQPDAGKVPPKMIGTTHGISNVGVHEVRRRLSNMYTEHVQTLAMNSTDLHNLSCSGLIEEYRMELTS